MQNDSDDRVAAIMQLRTVSPNGKERQPDLTKLSGGEKAVTRGDQI